MKMSVSKISIVVGCIVAVISCVESRYAVERLQNRLLKALDSMRIGESPLNRIELGGLTDKGKMNIPSIGKGRSKEGAAIREPAILARKRQGSKRKGALFLGGKMPSLQGKLPTLYGKIKLPGRPLKAMKGKEGLMKSKGKVSAKRFLKSVSSDSMKLGRKRAKISLKELSTPLTNAGVRQRLAEKLGLDGKFKFFDGRNGVFLGSLGKDLKPLDLLDQKLAFLDKKEKISVLKLKSEKKNRKSKSSLGSRKGGSLATRSKKVTLPVEVKTIGDSTASIKEDIADAVGEVDEKITGLVESGKENIRSTVDSALSNATGRKLLGSRSRPLMRRAALGLVTGLKPLRKPLRRAGRLARLPKLGRLGGIFGPKVDAEGVAAIADVFMAGIKGESSEEVESRSRTRLLVRRLLGA